MKLSPWLGMGIGSACLAGILFALFGALRFGRVEFPETAGGDGKRLLSDAKKKVEQLVQKQEQQTSGFKKLAGLKGTTDEHRVFVSATLVYLPQNPEPVQPLDRKMVTEDGIEIGWKMNYGFDPADPLVRDQDPDGDGFTNQEEFVAKTNPLEKGDSPAKESKLRNRLEAPVLLQISFVEKSGNSYTIRFQSAIAMRQFKGKPGDLFWVMAGPDKIEIFSDASKLGEAKEKADKAGTSNHAVPFQFVSYTEKIDKEIAEGTGVVTDADNSFIVLQRKDALEESLQLVFGTSKKRKQIQIDFGEIRFYSPASGGITLGPFRIGESFAYEGKEFAILGKQDGKVVLENRSEPDRKQFLVPPDTRPMPPKKEPNAR